MSTYAIGDVQGCARTLERLLVALAPATADRLWLVGDLVNRGPHSLDVLRWARATEATVVLGNHDLHLLGVAAGVRARKRKDTLDAALAAPDRDALVETYLSHPGLHRFERRGR